MSATAGKKQIDQVVLFSDGGGERSSNAAGACIVENPATGKRRNFVIFLGGATNNEAEICGALAGFSFLALLARQKKSVGQVRWVSDSEYVLKSATEYIHAWQRNGWKTAAKKPVKNQGLWRSYLALSAGLRIVSEHVRGHTGHVENEACDMAATWGQLNGEQVLEEEGAGATVELSGDEQWTLLDGRPFLERLRDTNHGEPARDDFFLLVDQLEQAGAGKKGKEPSAKSAPAKSPVVRRSKPALRPQGEAEREAEGKAPGEGEENESPNEEVQGFLERLEALYEEARAVERNFPPAAEIARVLKKYL